jgi:hypothetical protein
MATAKTPTVEELQAEVERLRSELSAKSAGASESPRQTARDTQDEITKAATDTNDTALDQLYRLVQGANAATAELLRSGTDILVKLNDEATVNGRTNQDDLVNTLSLLPADLYKGYLRALGRAAEVPGRMAQEFTKTHSAAAKP